MNKNEDWIEKNQKKRNSLTKKVEMEKRKKIKIKYREQMKLKKIWSVKRQNNIKRTMVKIRKTQKRWKQRCQQQQKKKTRKR